VACDYAATHRDGTIGRNAFELLDQWIADQDEADADHIALDVDGKTLVDLGWDIASHTEPFDRNDRDVLEPDLVAAIREMFRSARIARDHLGVLQLDPPPLIADNALRLAYRRVVREAPVRRGPPALRSSGDLHANRRSHPAGRGDAVGSLRPGVTRFASRSNAQP
jgi:hypothetical protein